jgi:hypothetical protein
VAVPGAQCRVFVAHETIGGDGDENNGIRVELRYAANRLVAWWYREGRRRSGGDVQGGWVVRRMPRVGFRARTVESGRWELGLGLRAGGSTGRRSL